MTYKYTSSNSFEVRQSSTWANIISFATKIAKNNPGHPVHVYQTEYPERISEYFTWNSEQNDIIPYYGEV